MVDGRREEVDGRRDAEDRTERFGSAFRLPPPAFRTN
jgi:hypothetical protein